MKRTYTSPVRAAGARETHAAILRAAESLFVERGYVQTTVAGIAERAGVALNTVYTSVGGKPAIVEALAVEGTEDEGIQASLAAVHVATEPREVLRLTAESTGAITRRHEAILTVLFDNATADPAVAAAAEQAIKRYREHLSVIAEHLVGLGAVHTDEVRTEQVLWFFFGQTAWKTVRGFGWSWTEGAEWLTAQAASALLP
ncbi:transcriptional regulator, TetR family [Catenulispora acidiphila DSM 44928]|uniref:Transcriptional regulator, TetR family n=1 Tax=Catenulispora acidiphila (strain DSM 44928 / JCM 14897 / NBRC 102108 / NRRL B-24433 / ID139908) TaxID=479433 RepID=C7QI52_CATAD|nr:transcriptional regulator, TetR family [Catenulispora acidiphila DSM 44928]